jgi:hypothetical protein
MTIKSISVLENPIGRGRLVGPKFDAPVSYSLEVTQEMMGDATLAESGATTPGLKKVAGRVEFAASEEQPGLSERLVLHLAEVRKLKVLYLGGGRVQGTGAFF